MTYFFTHQSLHQTPLQALGKRDHVKQYGSHKHGSPSTSSVNMKVLPQLLEKQVSPSKYDIAPSEGLYHQQN